MLVTLSSIVGFKLPEEQEDALDFEKSMGKEWTKALETETCVIFTGKTSTFAMLYSRYEQIFAENHCNCAGTEFDLNVRRDCVFYRTEENMARMIHIARDAVVCLMICSVVIAKIILHLDGQNER